MRSKHGLRYATAAAGRWSDIDSGCCNPWPTCAAPFVHGDRISCIFLALLAAVANGALPSTPDLGKAEARCRNGEDGPAFLIQQGKVFRRVEVPVPRQGRCNCAFACPVRGLMR